MFRYIVSLILVNTYYCSSGHPVPQNGTGFKMPQPLIAVANDCKNQFLADLTKSQVNHCNFTVPPFSRTELECLMFYEISSRLCSQTYHSGIDLNDNYSKKTQNVEDVQTLCDNAITWEFLHLKKYPELKLKLETALNKKTACIKLCSVEDVLNEDSSFFCKFFQWGSELLKSQDTTTAQHEVISGSTTQNSAQNKTLLTTLKVDNITVPKSNNDIKNSKPSLLNSEIKTSVIEENAQSPNEALESNIIETDNNKSSQDPAPSIKPSEKSIAVAEEPPKQELVEKVEPAAPEQKDVKPNAKVENAKQNVDLDDDAENEFGNDPDLDDDPMSEQDGENGNDQVVESDPKLEVEKPKAVDKKIESITSLQQEGAQRESAIFPNPIQESFSEDDDHFFPFFLTAIIFVIVLYVLYHNKTKFTKVILGLIVEGRQTGRRRNSRGHSYRRLDTLEQAMSSNTAAPPSKIIY